MGMKLRGFLLSVMALAFASNAQAQTLRTVPTDVLQFNMVGNMVTVSAGAVTASYSLLLPPAQGTNAQGMVNNGSGVLNWVPLVQTVGGVAPIQVSGTSAASVSITQATTSTNGYLSSTDWNTFNGKASYPINVSSASGVLATIYGGTGVSGSAVFPTSGTVDTTTAANTLSNKTLASPVVTGTATFNGSSSGDVALQAPSVVTTYTLTLPTTGGTNGYFLQTNGSGTTTWASAATGAGLMPSGTTGSPNLITAGGGITVTGNQRELDFVAGSGGAVTVTANPAISAGSTVGQELVIAGTSNTNTVTFTSGNGIDINGDIVIGANGAGSKIWLVWDGTNWSETNRR